MGIIVLHGQAHAETDLDVEQKGSEKRKAVIKWQIRDVL
jgi:hypothetical protein